MVTKEITPHDELTVLKLLARNGNTLGFVSLSTSLPTDAVKLIGEQYGWPDREQIKRAIPLVQREIDAAQRDELMVGAPRLHPGPTLTITAPRPVSTVEPASNPVAKPVVRARGDIPANNFPADVTSVDTNPGSAEWERVVELGGQSHRAATRALASRLLATHQQLRDALKEEAEYRVQQEREARQRAEIESEIAALEAQLAAARAKLKPALKSVKSSSAVKSGSSPASVRALRERHEYQKEFRARFGVTTADLKAWGRSNGFTVGEGSMIARPVLDAYENAHRDEVPA